MSSNKSLKIYRVKISSYSLLCDIHILLSTLLHQKSWFNCFPMFISTQLFK